MSYTRKATRAVEAQARQLDRDYSRTVSRIAAMRRRAAAHERLMAMANGQCCDDTNNKEVIAGDQCTSQGIACTSSNKELCNGNPVMAKKRFRSFQQGPNALEEKYRPQNIPAVPTVSTLKEIIGDLDNLADYCEKCGELKLAASIDVISNTLEQEQ